MSRQTEPKRFELPQPYPGGMRIGQEEIDAVVSVMKSHAMTRYGGPAPSSGKFFADKFEDAFKDKMGVKYATAVRKKFSVHILSILDESNLLMI
jgi:dTDP-4-amino-4,6-dideoxygalactose transaminase